jgi:hypothetical protein
MTDLSKKGFTVGLLDLTACHCRYGIISVAGGDSVMPPWVRIQFREASLIVRHLRDTNCGDTACGWCVEKNDPNKALERWFGFPAFRPQPVNDMGRPLQGCIVDEAMAGKSVLAMAALDDLIRQSQLDPDWSWRLCAVIARDWRRLKPLRAYAEAKGIAVDLTNETMPSLWRLREMQAFIRALLADRSRLLTIPDLVDILNGQPQTRWTDLIGEGIGTLARELVEMAAPVPDLVEWFGEWAREARGEQRAFCC